MIINGKTDIECIKEMWTLGLSAQDITVELVKIGFLPPRTRNSIIGIVTRAGLTRYKVAGKSAPDHTSNRRPQRPNFALKMAKPPKPPKPAPPPKPEPAPKPALRLVKPIVKVDEMDENAPYLKLTIEQLKNNQCRWVMVEVNERGDFLFCGQPTDNKKSYCERCRRKMYALTNFNQRDFERSLRRYL